MGLESATYVNDLNSANPVAGDPRNEGDDHLRLLKSVLKATFPNMAGRFHRTQVKSANYTAVGTDESTTLSVDTTGVTIALTAAATLGNGWSVLVYADGFDVTIDPNGSETIDGAATIVLPAGASCLIACDGTKFYTFGRALTGGNLTGAINTAAFSVAAHATTCNIWTGGNVCTLTGSATIFTDVADAPQAGATRIVKCDAAHVFTDNANMDVAGGTFTAEAGDWLLFEAVTPSTFKVTPFKGDGSSVKRRVGELIDWPYPNTPSYALLCDGSAVSSSVYADLFAKSVKTATVTITIASPGVISWTGHGLYANAPVKFTTTGALPTGITAGTTYYVISAGLTADTFRISATIGGAAINTSGSQSGVHTAIHAPHGCANDLSTFNVPNIPAEYATVQASSGNEGITTLGQVINHSHSMAFAGTGGGTGGTDYITSSTGGASRSVGNPPTGGAANLAAGLYVRKCIIF